ncbi:glycosyltransferase involved in cell wall biosynthesis [Croceicoccus sp. BE223]|nr:glycosyltransferase involved in cell wall biosynthesis [Croceicoccus sp. BE223]
MLPFAYQFCPWLIPSEVPPTCDVVIANSWNAGALRTGDVPLVTISHHVVHLSELSPYKTRAQRVFHSLFIKPLERRAIAKSGLVVTPSASTARDVEKVFGPAPVRTILNGIDTEFFCPDENHRAKSSGPVRLLFVGKPSRRKGFHLVAELMSLLGSKATLTIAGPRPERGLPDVEADWQGRVSDERLRELYRNADFLIFPSRLEGFGYVAAEAMACGTPVICLAGGAVEEVVRPPEGGIILDPSNICTAKEAILCFVTDGKSLEKLRQGARNRACQFSFEQWIGSFESALFGLINKR